MTTFLESPRFPACVSFGFTSEPMYAVSVVERTSGIETRNRIWSRPLYRYTATLGPRVEAEVQEALEFYHAVGGRAYGFRFKDAADYLSCRVGETPSETDCPLVIDSSESPEVWQMVKTYTAGALTQQREIYKPVSGTIKIADNGTLKTETTHYVVDYATGIVTFNYTPSATVTWGGEFDVPVRFDSEFPVEIQNQRIQSASFALKELRLGI
jgi:uncharacterized protein (TIGR02217 family)